MEDELEIFKQMLKPSMGRCNACQHHIATVDENQEIECWCDLEEHEKENWFPGMHMDSCIFPPSTPDDCCPCFVKHEHLP